jgi:hypothetical protein
MAHIKFLLPALLGLASCAPSPLYIPARHPGTVGEIPRDGRGEPIWGVIHASPPPPAQAPMPVAGGIQIIPPPR